MARSTDEPGDYEVLPDEEEERYGRDVRRRLQREGRRPERREDGRGRRRFEDDDEPVRRRRGKRNPFPRVVNLLGLACALTVPMAGALGLAGLVIFVGRPNRFTWIIVVLFAALTLYYGQIAWGVWKRRASGELLRKCGWFSLIAGGLMAAVSGPAVTPSLQRAGELSTISVVMGAILFVALWLIGIGLLAFVTREELRRWAGRRFDGLE